MNKKDNEFSAIDVSAQDAAAGRWVAPAVTRLEAGSAENFDIPNQEDGFFTFS